MNCEVALPHMPRPCLGCKLRSIGVQPGSFAVTVMGRSAPPMSTLVVEGIGLAEINHGTGVLRTVEKVIEVRP